VITFAVLATGPSITQEIADYARKFRAVAVSDAYRLAPWADAVVSHDPRWWAHHVDALRFEGRKFCASFHPGTETIPRNTRFAPDCNSGLDAMRVAHEVFGASRLLLIGFDMHGSHFFGSHPTGLQNTPSHRFASHIRQFQAWNGCAVVNCTPGSALTQFPFIPIEEIPPEP
jgi:hypothetical protein